MGNEEALWEGSVNRKIGSSGLITLFKIPSSSSCEDSLGQSENNPSSLWESSVVLLLRKPSARRLSVREGNEVRCVECEGRVGA